MSARITRQFTIPDALRGLRLDQALAELVPDCSRARLQQWIRSGEITLDERAVRARDRVAGGEHVCIDAELAGQTRDAPEPIALQLVYEDAALLVINKPAGLVVHPAAGNPAGTLLNALLHHDPGLAALPRAGIVHRLDKDTSGLLVVARTLAAHKALVAALAARDVHREYLALVYGVLTAGATIDAPVGRHPVDRKRMAVVSGGKPAVTRYRVEERFRMHSLLRVQLETGRTHQIRVHLAHRHYPIVGDPVYGGRLRLPAGASAELRAELQAFRRQALHAVRLSLQHPASGETVSWEAPLPDDMARLINAMRADAREHTDGA
jgi:23S rRNA pseudouridine1911/1915/1917 synthase